MTLSEPLKAFTGAAADLLAKAISDVQKEAQRHEEIRALEHRAFMAEQREAVAGLTRQLEERLAAVKDGADGKDGTDGKDAYAGEAKGLYDPDGSYRALDIVSFNGSEWRAKLDDPGPLPGDGWMLSAQRGKRGDKGASFSSGLLDKDTFELCLRREDGEEVVIDLSALRGDNG